MPPEAQARTQIDQLLQAAGWLLCNVDQVNLHAAQGVAIREFPLQAGDGFADYLLYVNGKACGVIEAKKEGVPLKGVEVQSSRYAKGLPDTLPAWRRPLPFVFESTGVETQFTNGLDPQPRSRRVFAFFRPELLALWLQYQPAVTGPVTGPQAANRPPSTLLARMNELPPLITQWEQAGSSYQLWPAQTTAVQNLEASLAANKPRALIQMATGSGKTFTAITFIYRLITFGGARRVLFLVDRANLGRQTKKEFDQYASPYNSYRFGEEYIVQHLQGKQVDSSARVVICTIQRMFSLLKGKELAAEEDEISTEGVEHLFKDPEPIAYNPAFPIELFDIVVTDEAHRSIYKLWRQVLEYYDAYLIGLTATPNKQTFGFFNQNLVMEYGHTQAVADGVNVNYDVYRIQTEVTAHGAKVEKGYWLETVDKASRRKNAWLLDEDFEYDPAELDRSVQTPDQIRTVIRTLRERLFADIFPGRSEVPKTLVFAKDDNHAEKIVETLREEFAKGNDFAQKITYRSTGSKPEELISAFRNSYFPRVAVTVDMIATGTDIKPVEMVMFMRSVKSRSFFEQMKGRGVRICNPADLQAVTPDAKVKDHFVIIDTVGVCERDKTDSRPMDSKKTVPLDKLLQAVSLGNVEDEVLSSVAARLARLDKDLAPEDHANVQQASGGKSLRDMASALVQALNLDEDTPPAEAQARRVEAAKPFANPALRQLILQLRQKAEQVIDIVTQDKLLHAGFSQDSRERAQTLVQSFEAFIETHKDEITALQILYNRPSRAPLSYADVKALADALHAPPHQLDESQLWQAYAALDKTKVKGSTQRRLLTDLVSLVRYAMQQDNELVPYPQRVQSNFKAWLAQQQTAKSQPFSPEQLHWLEMIRDHIAGNLHIEADDFEYTPFDTAGGLGKVYQLFGADLTQVMEEMNRELVA